MKKIKAITSIAILTILLIWRNYIFKANFDFEIVSTLTILLLGGILYLIIILFKENSQSNIENDSFQKQNISKTLFLDLEKSSIKHRQFGLILTAALLVLIFGMTLAINLYFIPNQASEIKSLINSDKNSLMLLMYYLGRAIIFGSFFSGSIYFIFKLAKNSFDQSVRYRKRFNSIIFTKYIAENDNFLKLINSGKTNDILLFIESLTKNVESAFTDKESIYKSKKSFDLNDKGGKVETDDELK